MQRDAVLLSRSDYPWECVGAENWRAFNIWLQQRKSTIERLMPEGWKDDNARPERALAVLNSLFPIMESVLSDMNLFAHIEAAYDVAGIDVIYSPGRPIDSFFWSDKAFCLKGKALILDGKKNDDGTDEGDISVYDFEERFKARFPFFPIKRLTELTQKASSDLNILLEGGNFVYDPFNDKIFLGIPVIGSRESVQSMASRAVRVGHIIANYFNTEVELIYFKVPVGMDISSDDLQALNKLSGKALELRLAELESIIEEDVGKNGSPAHLDQCLVASSKDQIHFSNFVEPASVKKCRNMGFLAKEVNVEASVNTLNIAHLTPQVSITTIPNPVLEQDYVAAGRILHVLPSTMDAYSGGAHCLVNRTGFENFWDDTPRFESAGAFAEAIKNRVPQYLLRRQRAAVASFCAILYLGERRASPVPAQHTLK